MQENTCELIWLLQDNMAEKTTFSKMSDSIVHVALHNVSLSKILTEFLHNHFPLQFPQMTFSICLDWQFLHMGRTADWR